MMITAEMMAGLEGTADAGSLEDALGDDASYAKKKKKLAKAEAKAQASGGARDLQDLEARFHEEQGLVNALLGSVKVFVASWKSEPHALPRCRQARCTRCLLTPRLAFSLQKCASAR